MIEISIIYSRKPQNSNYNLNNYLEYKPNTNWGVSIITCTNRPSHFYQIFDNYLRQDYKKKEMVVILNNNKMDIYKYKKFAQKVNNIKIFQLDEDITLGECKNFGFEHTRYDYIAFFDDDDYYGPNFLEQSINTFSKVNCDMVGKSSFYIYFEDSKDLVIYHNTMRNAENQYVKHVVDSSLVIKRKVFEKIKFPKIRGVGETIQFEKDCITNGFKIYSTDKSNYVAIRHPNPTKNHTWQESKYAILLNCEIFKKNINDFVEYINH